MGAAHRNAAAVCGAVAGDNAAVQIERALSGTSYQHAAARVVILGRGVVAGDGAAIHIKCVAYSSRKLYTTASLASSVRDLTGVDPTAIIETEINIICDVDNVIVAGLRDAVAVQADADVTTATADVKRFVQRQIASQIIVGGLVVDTGFDFIVRL